MATILSNPTQGEFAKGFNHLTCEKQPLLGPPFLQSDDAKKPPRNANSVSAISTWNARACTWIDKRKTANIEAFNRVMQNLRLTFPQKIQSTLDEAGSHFERFFEDTAHTIVKTLKVRCDIALKNVEVRFPKYSNSIKNWIENNSFSYKILNNLANFLEFVIGLPLKSASNILKQLYRILKIVPVSVIHPLETTAKLAKLIINFVHSLTQSETWVKMGVGMMGAGLAQMALGNLFASPAIIIGAIITTSAVSMGAVIAAIQKKQGETRIEAILSYLLKTGKQIPEAMMTGFLIGLLIGAIQKATSKPIVETKTEYKQFEKRIEYQREPTLQDIEEAAHKFAHENQIRRLLTEIKYDPSSGEVSFAFWTKGGWVDPARIECTFKLSEYCSLQDFKTTMEEISTISQFTLIPPTKAIEAVIAGGTVAAIIPIFEKGKVRAGYEALPQQLLEVCRAGSIGSSVI